MRRRVDDESTGARRTGVVVGRRVGVLGIATAMVIGIPGGTVFADAAGPTDYLSHVRSVTPAVDGLDVGIAGGDAFLGLAVRDGIQVEVPGYEGEPYLRFLADGTVLENRRSPAFYLNTDRYARDTVPADITAARASADPDWVEVSSDGSWWWHDHRIHWMSDVPPLGLGPGDAVVDGVIPLEVTADGQVTRVEIRVTSTWQDPPSAMPAWIGVALGAVLTAAWPALRRRPPPERATLAVGAIGVVPGVAATVVGLWQFASLPAATGPDVGWWLLPATSTLAALAAAGAAVRRREMWELTAAGLVLVAGVQNGRWVLERWEVLPRAILPTEAPGWFDRAVTAGCALTAAAAVAGSAVALVTAVRRCLRRPGPAVS